MLGVLLDISKSMEDKFAVHYDGPCELTNSNVKRSHRIITTLNNIVNQEINAYDRKDLVFATAFGLNDAKCNGVNTCNFIALLEKKKEMDEKLDRWENEYPSSGYKILIQFAKDKNTPHAEPWIKDKLTQQRLVYCGRF